MFLPRYGKVPISGFWSLLLGPLIMLLLSALAIFGSGNVVLSVIVVFINIYILGYIFYPFTERFAITDGKITIKKLFLTSERELPEKMVAVFSQADIHYSINHQSYYLKEKVAVSFLSIQSAEDVLAILHVGKMSKRIYTNSSIEMLFPYHHVYSFVVDESTLKPLLQSHVSAIIIPESVREKLGFAEDYVKRATIDFGW